MRQLLIVVILITFLLSSSTLTMAYEKEIKSLSSTMAESIARASKKSVAVVDFTDLEGNVTGLGRFIAEEFSVALAGAGKGFAVVDRTHLKTILKEHKLATTGVIDPATAKKLGQIAGIDALVTGTVTPFGDSVRLFVKILDTATAKVIGASSGDIAKTKAIEELLEKEIETAVAPTPGVIGPTPIPTRPKAIQKVESNKFTVELQGCKISGGSVTCDFLITNNAEDREIVLYARGLSGESRLFDDRGNVYIAKEVQIGNIGGSYDARLLLVSGVPTKASLTFENVSLEAKAIALLELLSSDFKVKFRNIPLTR